MVINFYFKLFILSVISTLRVECCSFIIHLVIISNYGFLTTVVIYDHLIFLTHCKEKLVSLFRCLYSFSFPIIQMNIPSFHSFYRTSCLDFSYKISSFYGWASYGDIVMRSPFSFVLGFTLLTQI